MKKVLITLLVLIGLAAVCVVTCPDRQKHKEALMSLVNSKLNQEMSKISEDDGLALFGSAIGSKIIEAVLDNKLDVQNHFIYSLGQLETEEGINTVSVGVLGHVFTTSKEDFSEAVDQAKNE